MVIKEKDFSSLSNPQDAVVKHLDWNINVDFDLGVVSGTATYQVEHVPNCPTLCLDTAYLLIISVIDAETGEGLNYQLHPWIPGKLHLGQKLEITLPSSPTTTATKVTIRYATTGESSALQWLPPEQTAGKKYPYLFTQCQAIHARTLVPCQDAPGVKFTYKAKVTVPSWAIAVMSAVLSKEEYVVEQQVVPPTDDDTLATVVTTMETSFATTSTTTTTRTFAFEQTVPIPSYLLAMAVGDLVCHDLSERCAVWTEPSLVEAAAYEFGQTEDFLQIAEEIAGTPYVWGRYDLLLLPPSFPYGGMENPCLTFVTPTLLAGDRSLADVVAHEISHSWTGNLVTNATWDHFWLNEGWTTWFQRVIMNRIHQNEQFRDMDAIGGVKTLQDAIQELPPNHTTLVLNIQDGDPDEAYSTVAYEKGFLLLYTLEQRVGSPTFMKFFQQYVKEFAYQTLTTRDFQDFCLANLPDVQDFDWNTWLYEPGMPPTLPKFDRTLIQEAEDLALQWIDFDRRSSNREKVVAPPDQIQESWSSEQTTCFLDTIETLAGGKPLQPSTLAALNSQYQFVLSKNAEILFRYCKLAVAAEDDTCLPVVVSFITSQGRMKYVRPLYRALAQSKMGREVAITTFSLYQDTYHPIGAKMIAYDLQQQQLKKKKLFPFSVDDPVVWMWAAGVAAATAVVIGLVLLRRPRT